MSLSVQTRSMVDPDSERLRQQWGGTLAPDVLAFLQQPEINASRLVEAAVREKVADHRIEEAATAAGITEEQIEKAKRT